MYSDNSIRIEQHPEIANIYYSVRCVSSLEGTYTMEFDERIFLDLTDERVNDDELSKILENLDPVLPHALSRGDITRINFALLEARKTYDKGFEEFRRSENL